MQPYHDAPCVRPPEAMPAAAMPRTIHPLSPPPDEGGAVTPWQAFGFGPARSASRPPTPMALALPSESAARALALPSESANGAVQPEGSFNEL